MMSGRASTSTGGEASPCCHHTSSSRIATTGAIAQTGSAPTTGAARTSRLTRGTRLVHADLHNHTLLSDGDGDPALAFASMRSAGLDVAAHLASGAVLALLVRRLLLRLDLLPSQGGRRAAVSRVLHTVNAVVLLGLLWELGEWAGNAWFSPEIGVGYEDTLVDLAADGLGALAAALLAERSSARDRLPAGSRSR